MACESSTSRSAYDVFLSFRGGDTRKNFTDHLYTALVQAGIHTFRDDDEIPRGGNIETVIKKAIQESKISVVVLSKDYASSRWCLDELVLILERKKSVGHLVVPVFYDVGPHQVGNLSGSYGEAFGRHEVEFKEEMGLVEAWREALRKVGDMGGMVLKDRYLSQFIQDIVKEVGSKLKRTLLNVAPYLVGIESRIADINLWLQDGSNDDVELAVIYGVGGIGKTTAAKAVYNQNFDKFEARSFLSNVREISEQPNGLVRLQRQLLSDVLKGKVNKIYNVDEGITKIQDVVCRRRLLLVLDDVDQMEQFKAIIGMRKWFCKGSKIIVTTRYENLLRAQGIRKMFSIKELDNEESIKLFSWHAFGKDHPVEGYIQLSESAVSLCSGLPLALQVLGSSLSGKSKDVWQSAIEKLEAIPDSKIQKILKVSYDSLHDDHDRSIFLDIACFFSGMGKDYVVTVLNGCGFYILVGLHNLIARCLVTINEDNKLMMHQMLRDMGREIVRQESPDDPGKRSRLWRHRDAITVLQENSGTSTIKGLTLSMQISGENNPIVVHTEDKSYGDSVDQTKIRCIGNISNWQRNEVFSLHSKNGVTNRFNETNLKTKAFASMDRLKLLQLNNVKLQGEFGDFPKSLVWLHWRGFPLKSIPHSFHLENLVALDMRNSNLINAWRGKMLLVKLKFLNLSHCHGLVRTPNFTGVPSLERLKLKGCINLVEVDESIGSLQRLILLNLEDCKSLTKLPGKISSLKSLMELNLSGCSKLHCIPQELERMELSEELHADQLSFRNMQWNSIFRSWFLPRDPQSVSFSLSLLPCSLVDLRLADCNISDIAIPNDLSCLRSLENLDLRGNPIHNLPESINYLTSLQYLYLDRCTSLKSLPELPPSLEELKAEGCTSLQRVTNLPNLLTTLQVELFGCEQLVEVQGMFKLESLVNVDTEMTNDLGLFELEFLESTDMTLFNTIANREINTPPQVLQECGIYSFFHKGSEVPSWFEYKGTGSFVSFEVVSLPGHRIRGLNLCTVYARDEEEFWLHAAGHYAKIHNATKGITWSYSPTFYAIPEDDDSILWLSHWRFGDELESGDEVDVFVCMPLGFYVKDCGIRIVYEEEDNGNQEDGADIVRGASISRQNITDINLSMYQVGEAIYFLHHHPFTTPAALLTQGRMTAYFSQ